MLYNQFSHNPESRFLKEIPRRLTEEEYSDGYRPRQETPGYGWGRRPYMPPTASRREETARRQPGATEQRPTPNRFVHGVSDKPKLTLKGVSLDQIPGVNRGFVPSAARQISFAQRSPPGRRKARSRNCSAAATG